MTITPSSLNSVADQIGGATVASVPYTDSTAKDWVLFNMANRLAITPRGAGKGPVYELKVPGAVQNITLIKSDDVDYALLALGDHGIGVVDLSNPMAMKYLETVNVHYNLTGVNYVDGGGTITTDATFAGSGVVTDLAVDDTTGTLYIANSAYGIQATALTNLLPTPVLDSDGTLHIDSSASTLQYAGESPWGGPLSLKLFDGKLYAALGFLGIGIYDPATLAREGGYNLYSDASVSEDWFQDMNVANAVHDSSWVDPVTGMPTYLQTQYEIQEVWKNDVTAPTPWADFDRYGKYYYNARKMALKIESVGGQDHVYAYIAYSLGGLVAVDLGALDSVSFPSPSYLGYLPAVPAHGPDSPTTGQSSTKSLFPHFGSGMLKEAGVVDVAVNGDRVYYSDHFAGLVVASGALDPQQNWHGPNGRDGYNNDTMPTTPFWPDYEFVTSYDMTPRDATEEESLPTFLYQSPVELATGEISGHGGALFITPGADPGAAGGVDLVQATGAGGLNFIDVIHLTSDSAVTMADRFAVPAQFASTDASGAQSDGQPGQIIAIGHAAGVTVRGSNLYVADGPHGMSVWRIADSNGDAIDKPLLLANTLQSEGAVNLGGEEILPTPHAYAVHFNTDSNKAYVLSQSLGLRGVDVSAVNNGTAQVGAPALLRTYPSDIYEHSTESGNVGGIKGQDHAYDVAFHGHYGVVADGSNGLVVYDLSADPSDGTGAHIVAVIGNGSGKPSIGRASSVRLWTDRNSGRVYAIVAAGSAGVAVVDMTGVLKNGDPSGWSLVKVFEPKKFGDGTVGAADGKSVDVSIANNTAYFSYDSFGLVAYRLADLIAPLPDGVDPTAIWSQGGGDGTSTGGSGGSFDYRPDAIGSFKLQDQPGYEDNSGGAQYMTLQHFPANVVIRDGNDGHIYQLDQPRVYLYVAYGTGGVIKLDWSSAAMPKLIQYHDTVGEATSTAIANGRVYVADGSGGVIIFK